MSTIHLINALGGIKAIAISHPHYYSTIAEWSSAFGGVPVYIHKLDEQHLCKRPANLQLWEQEELMLWNDMKLIRCGGHFEGACVLYTPHNNGSLFVGDTIQVTPDLKTVSFMYSYPNLIPLPKKNIIHIQNAVAKVDYSDMYGAFGRYLRGDAKRSMEYSVQRYLKIFNE